MRIIEIFILAVGLAMDAFAVSICKGLCVKQLKLRQALACGLWFGGFQMAMPLIGYFLGRGFYQLIASVGHWVAFVLLALIGGNMIKESLEKEEAPVCQTETNEFGVKAMLPLAVATSIDALMVGISFAALDVAALPASAAIGVMTMGISMAGVAVGRFFGIRWKSMAERLGGIVLILLGLRILISALFF